MATSWISISPSSPFSLANIPFGIISSANDSDPRPAVAIGEYALDLRAFAADDGFSGLPSFKLNIKFFSQSTRNDFAALGRPVHSVVRKYLQEVFTKDGQYGPLLEKNEALKTAALLPLSSVKNYLPLRIGDYTDFYAGLNHAYNVGVLFRGADNALQPNYKHLPVGYHGRASSVVVSGTPVRRPRGQILPAPGAKEPIFSPCKKLDIELELACFVSIPNALGEPVSISEAEDHIFGIVLMNDWSARDIQAWEYVPLGPFNAKNFATSISPWVVLVDALEPFRSQGLKEDGQQLLPYLTETKKETVYDIKLEVELKTSGSSKGAVISKTNAKNLLFSFPQMVAHHTITGCNLQPGDLLGSGTISGTENGSLGSMLEQTKNGKEPLSVAFEDGTERRFLEDGDEVTIKGFAGEEGAYVGFGECKGVILPSFT
jgi:fumarylacetoacetase